MILFSKKDSFIRWATLLSAALVSCTESSASSARKSESDRLSSSSDFSSVSDSQESSLEETDAELIRDRSFSTGFHLREWTTVNGGPIVRHLDYGGTATSSDPIWTMARWWDPFDFKNAVESKEGDAYRYEDQSSYCLIYPGAGKMTMHLNSYTEYEEKFGGSRSSASQNWSHFLIEQSSFALAPSLTQLKKLTAKVSFRIDQCDLLDSEHYNPSLHTAQLFWYLTLSNRIDSGETDQGTDGDYMWFGIPLFDYRYQRIAEYKNIDSGVTGSTNKLIYSLANDIYLPVSENKGIELGKDYTIDFDILPYLREAFVYGKTHGCLVGADASRIRINYMNFGWELPGSFAITSTVQDFSLTALL